MKNECGDTILLQSMLNIIKVLPAEISVHMVSQMLFLYPG